MKTLFHALFFTLVISFSLGTQATEAQDKVQPMYLNGEINPAYMMQTAVIFGEVVDIKITPNGKRFYYVDQKLKGVNPVSVYFFYTLGEDEIKLGDRIQFTGHFKPVQKMEASGQLEKFLGKKMVLYSRVWLKP